MPKHLPILLTIFLLLPTISLAAHKQSLEERVTELEQRNAELYHALEEKKSAGQGTLLGDKLRFSGLLEVEASLQGDHFKNGADSTSSDLTLATAQLGFNATANDNLSADLVLLFEEGENNDNIAVDEGTINLSFGPWQSRLGRQYVPFGNFYSHFISDPMTLELGETQETAALLAYEQQSWTLAAFLFNGDADRIGDEDQLNDYGFSLILSPLENLEMGISYLSDLGDSDAELALSYAKRVAGVSAYFVTQIGPLNISAELLSAVEDFAPGDLDENSDGQGDQPVTWNLELATPLSSSVELAGRLEGSEEIAELPELQYGLCLSWAPIEQLSVSLEYLRGEFDAGFAPADNLGNRQESRDLLTAQLAYEF